MKGIKIIKMLFIVAVISIIIFGVSLYIFLKNTDSAYHNLPNDKMLISDKDITEYSLSKEQSMDSLNKILSLYVQDDRFAIYVEDYSTGSWLGVNEDKKIVPVSLLKVSTLVAVLKKLQDEKLSLNKKIALHEEDLDTNSGTLGINGEGYTVTVRRLIIDMIVNSDNTAVLTLNRRVLEDPDILETRTALGISLVNISDDVVTVTKIADTFRNIYFHTYINKEYSNIALNLMSKTTFKSQLPRGLPYDVVISHKVGFYIHGGYYHDCGIVYIPNRPYFICVMSSNVTQSEGDATISEISQIVYEYMASDSTSDSSS